MSSVGGVRTHACNRTLELESNPLDHSGTTPSYTYILLFLNTFKNIKVFSK